MVDRKPAGYPAVEVDRLLQTEKEARRLARRGCVVITLALGLLLPVLAHAGPQGFDLRESLTRLALGVAQRPWGVAVAILVYALAGVLFVPVNLLAAIALAVFGFWPGMGVAWVGGLLGALMSHTLGWHLGARALGWIPARVHRRLLALGRGQAFVVVVLMRILPVGNFGAFNLLAGAFKLSRRAYVLGNMTGLLIGLLGLGMIADRLSAMLLLPSVRNLLLLGLALALVAVGIFLLRRRYRAVLEVPRE